MKILVVGAGITGLAIAENLRREKLAVTLIDRIYPGDVRQASFGNAGMLAKSGIVPVSSPGFLSKIPRMLMDCDSPLFIRWSYLPRIIPWLVPFLRAGSRKNIGHLISALDSLTNDTVEQHQTLAAGSEATKYIKHGNFGFLYPNERAFYQDKFSQDAKQDRGYNFQRLDRSAILDLDPNISQKYNLAAIFSDHAWISSPENYTKAIFEYFLKHGGEFLKDEVLHLKPGGLILKSGQVIHADKIVIAAGAWSERLIRKTGLKAKLESESGYHLLFEGPTIMPPFPWMITDGKFIMTPMDNGLRCAGVVEFAGLDSSPSKAPSELIFRRVNQVYKNFGFSKQRTWMGHRPSTPDSLPLIGPIKGRPDIIMASGSQHLGLTIGAKIGLLVTNIITKKSVNLDLSPFDANRFSS